MKLNILTYKNCLALYPKTDFAFVYCTILHKIHPDYGASKKPKNHCSKSLSETKAIRQGQGPKASFDT